VSARVAKWVRASACHRWHCRRYRRPVCCPPGVTALRCCSSSPSGDRHRDHADLGAIQLRKEMEEWAPILSGLFRCLGILLLVRPGLGALAVSDDRLARHTRRLPSGCAFTSLEEAQTFRRIARLGNALI
jgi:hypothetical protein